MDMRSWKKVLLQWITECGFMDRNYFNIEQSDIDDFYQNYSLKHQLTSSGKYVKLVDFLKEFYPHFDINLDDENCLSSADYIYVYSLLLHFCCVKHPETMFHEICQKLPEYTQQSIASFFKEILDTEPITKEALRHAIAEVANTQSPPPRLNESFSGQSVNSSVGGFSSASFPRCESPLKTPKRSAGPQRISPSTPKSYLLEERTRELYNLRAQIETERYEKGLLEVQIKQNEDKIQKLNNDHKRLLQQIQDLKNDIIVKTSDGSTNHDSDEYQAQKRILKELSLKEQELIQLSGTVRTLSEEKTLVEEKRNYAEKQIVCCMSRIKELEFKVDELTEELEKKNDTIEYLTNSKMELEQFISDTRSSTTNLRPDLNVSIDCLDSSYVRNGSANNTTNSNSLNSPENLGASVVDVKLREKEYENQILKEHLQNVKRDHKRLAKHLSKLTQEFDKPIEATTYEAKMEAELENDNEEVEEEEEEIFDEETGQQVTYEEQFNIFNNCMEKIDKYHKTEKNKIKQLEQESINLQQENENLNNKLAQLNEHVLQLNQTILAKEKTNEELLQNKQEQDKALGKYQTDFLKMQKDTQELYNNLQLLEKHKDNLIKQIEELSKKLELQEKENLEIIKSNNDLRDQNSHSQTQLQDVQEKLTNKTNEMEEEIQKLTNKVKQQIEELKIYQETEQQLKNNYDIIINDNDLLKKQAREADIHMEDIKQQLEKKEKELAKLGQEIEDFKQKNHKLEQNIDNLILKYNEETLTLTDKQLKQEEYIKDIEKQLVHLKEVITKMEDTLKNKQQESEEKTNELLVIKTKTYDIFKLFDNSTMEKDFNNNLLKLKTKIESQINNNKNLSEQLDKLKLSELESKEKSKELQVIKTNIFDIFKLFNNFTIEKDFNNNLSTLKTQIESQLKENKDLSEKLDKFELAELDLQDKIETLSLDNKEKEEKLNEYTKSLEELTILRKQNLEYKENVENLKEKQLSILENCEQQLKKKDLEIQEHLKEAAREYENLKVHQMTIIEKCQQDLKQKDMELQEQLQEAARDKENLKEKQLAVVENYEQQLKKKDLELQEHLKEALSEYEASLERIGEELKLEKQHHNNKEIELLLIIADHNDVKKNLTEAEQEIQKLQIANKTLQEHYENLKKMESKVIECSKENEQLRQEIDNFKQEVTQNALRLLEADKALNEFMILTKQQDSNKTELEKLQIIVREKEMAYKELEEQQEKQKSEISSLKNNLKEKESYILELQEILKDLDTQKSEIKSLKNNVKENENSTLELEENLKLKEQEIQNLQQNIQEQAETIIILQEKQEQLFKDKEKLVIESREKTLQIQTEQQDKLTLLQSLEKSTDQVKLAQQERDQQKLSLEEKFKELKEEFDQLTQQNTKLQGDLLERQAELQQSQDEQKQEHEEYQQKFSIMQQKFTKQSQELESLDKALMEILAIMENNFNLSMASRENMVTNNLFNYQEIEQHINIQKLRQNLNHLLQTQQVLQQQLKENSQKTKEALTNKGSLEKSVKELQMKLKRQENIVKDLQEQLENEDLIMEKRVSQEVKRLEENLLNLEKVNERLANENVKIQVSLDNAQEEFIEANKQIYKLENEKLQFQEEIRSKTLAGEKLQQEEQNMQKSLKEKCLYNEKLIEKSKELERLLKEKSLKLQNLEKDHQDLKEKSKKVQEKLTQQQQQQQNQSTELKVLQENLKQIKTSNASLESEQNNKNKELLTLKNKNSELLQQHKEMEQQLKITSKTVDEMLTHKLNAETKCEQLLSESQQLKRDLEFIKSQQQTQQDDNIRLAQEIDALKIDKQHLRDEVRELKLSLQRSNDNVTQLIQQISSIRLEKEAALEENQLLRKQLEETGKNQSSSETKLKTIVEKSQDFERKLLQAENELKSLKVNYNKSENISEKLLTENKKLKESQEIATKRIEKLALKLGDSQARSAKLDRDNEKLGKTLEAISATVDALQKEKDLLQSEAKSLKERLSRAERGHEQLAAKVQNLEHLNVALQQTKQKLEASALDYKTKLNKLEKLRETNEEKIRKLTNSLNNAEHSNVQLNLEIGALNSQLNEVKTEHNHEQLHMVEELNDKLEQAQDLIQKYEEINEKLKIEQHQLKEENSSLKDELSKVSLSLDITKQKCEKLSSEIEQIRADMLIIRQEKSQVELQHETSIQKLSQFETQNTKLQYERKNLVKMLEQRILSLEEKLAGKSKEVEDLQTEILNLKENSESHSSLIQQTTNANLYELEQLRSKLLIADETMQKEQKIIAQLRLDNQILHTKYQESKQRALDAATSSEERIKENRLELEGKLEKMKNKMKTLYTEEITKMKTKQENQVALMKSEMEVLKTQNLKYEEHTRKLANQIIRLNDNILEHQKENTMLSTKLKHIMEQHHTDADRFRRPSSIHVSSISSTTAPVVAASANIGTNLAMEDEEGEVFNNTYLTDLKNGRMSELMNRDVCVEELKYRNSLLPPHLRSTYSAQYDHEFPEDDLKDGPHSLDDSMSALLSTTAGGTRKKCTGVTHYKRPGPPTPSKNGGRLSFGGISEPGREILKETYDTNAGSSAVSSSKTPARFNFFASRFSMGNTRDEKKKKPFIKQEPEIKPLINKEPEKKPLIKQESEELNLRKALQKPNRRKLLTGVGCTSTPRKSRIYYDQRRLLDQLMTSSPSPSPLALDNKHLILEKKPTPPDVSFIETPVTSLDKRDLLRAPVLTTNAKRMEAIAGGLRRNRRNSSMFGRRLSRRMQEICTPTSGENTSSALSTPVVDKVKRQIVCNTATTSSGGAGISALLQKRFRKRPKRERGDRPSMYLRGNIFAKYRTPNKGVLIDLNRYKSKKQRFEHFNLGRNMKSLKIESPEDCEKTISTTALKNRTYDLKNNNYVTFNQNKLGETVVITKGQIKDKHEEATFTFGEEVFETHDIEELEYMEDYESDEYYEGNEDDDDVIDHDLNCYSPLIDEYTKEELVTTQDLEEFDRFIAEAQLNPKKEETDEESYASNGSSQHFEKILTETESNAPFEVKHIQFNVSKGSRSSRSHSNQSSISLLNHTHPPILTLHSNSQHENFADHLNISTATPHNSPSNQNCGQFSRTIYGGTVIYNHRLPNINTTYVRKSSIYVKNKMNSSSCNDVVLITNQTITFVDLLHMWSQMDSSTRLIIGFVVLASFTAFMGVLVTFCTKT